MKKTVLLIAMLVMAISASAQERPVFSVVPYLGVNLANISHATLIAVVGDDTNEELPGKTKTGIAAGAELEYAINKWWGALIGLGYAQQGCKFSSYIDASTMKEVKISDNLHYLNLVIAPKFYVGEGFAFEAGLQTGVLLSANAKVEENGEKTHTNDIKGFCNRMAVSIPVGISFEYENVQLRLRYHSPLNKLYNSLLYSQCKNRQIAVTIGYRFAL